MLSTEQSSWDLRRGDSRGKKPGGKGGGCFSIFCFPWDIKIGVVGPKRRLRGYRCSLLFQRTPLWFPAPMPGCSKPPVTSALGEPAPTSGLSRYLDAQHTTTKTYTYRYTHKKFKKKTLIAVVYKRELGPCSYFQLHLHRSRSRRRMPSAGGLLLLPRTQRLYTQNRRA